MEPLYDPSAPRKATNLTVNRDLLRQARDLGINPSRALEERLVEIITEERRRLWLEENRASIEDYNARIGRRGVFSEGLRRF